MENRSKRQKQAWTIVLVICSLIIVLFPLLFSQSISSGFKKHMQEQRRSSISKMVHLAYNSIEPMVDKLRNGEINQAEARIMISDVIREMTYEDEFGANYIFMSTYDGCMLVQPFEPQKEGTDQWTLRDANGKFIVQELVQAAKSKPEGSFVTYDYYPPNRTEAEEKLSYVMGIPEIEAYIGTGMYVESTYNKLEAILAKQRYGFLVMTAFILISLLIYSQMLLKGNQNLQREIEERIHAENNIRVMHDELSSIYEELSATEEELRNQYTELQNAQIEMKALAERYISVSEGANDVIWYWDTRNDRIHISERLKELLGYSVNDPDIQYGTLLRMMHPEDRETFRRDYKAHLHGESEFFLSEYRLQAKDGSYIWFMSRGKAVVNQEGIVTRSAGSITDISERKQYVENIRHLAYSDNLTGLPNRVFIMNELQDRLEKCGENAGFGSVFFVDVDNFKVINDTHGHSFGDRLLIEIAKKLSVLSTEHLTISRIGGDEFLIVTTSYISESDIMRLADKILELFKETVEIDNTSFHITCSIGIAIYPKDGRTVEEILKYADLAMYKAKSRGKNSYAFYDNSMVTELSERTELEKNLREAYKNNEFVLYYQPQIDAENGRVIGIEALIRWNSSVYGFVHPGRFIEVAEEMGLINEIGKWVIESSFSFARNLMHKGICVSCNVSSVQLKQRSFVEDVIAIFERHGLKEGSVALEITESCLVESFEETSEKLASLRAHGIMIHLDDFGTGYSSLNYMKSLPIDVLKIDRSFVDDIILDGVERRIVKSIVSLAHEIGLKVIAEGVETKEQQEYLSTCGCNAIQGYLFSKPVPELEIMDMI